MSDRSIDDLSPDEIERKLRSLSDILSGRLMVGAVRAMYAAGFNGVAAQFRPDTWTGAPEKVAIRAAGTTPDGERLMLPSRTFTVAQLGMTAMADRDAEFERDAKALMARHLESRKTP